MKHQRIWLSGIGVLAAAVVAWALLRQAPGAASAYRFAAIERGDLASSISATGKLGAVTTVKVGTQVSGQVLSIDVDFNDHVKKGQRIARIDPTLQQQAVREAEAGLQRSLAERVKAESDYARAQKLFELEVLSASDLSTSKYALAVGRANAASGQVALDRARQNLGYTSIYSPIDGIVIERNVDVGQTVAASLSAPQLFLIANDLRQMQILASVDESDVSRIHPGMTVHFTVQADSKKPFNGTVQQLRLGSTTTENVVSYIVVIGVDNPSGVLLPGMTATVSFLTGEATGVLLVPNAALRIRATAAMTAEARGTAGADTSGGASPTRNASTERRRSSAAASVLWYRGTNGKFRSVSVQVGISDGQRTEVRGAGLSAGMQVLVGTSAASGTAGTKSSSPFQPSSSSNRGPGPPGGF